MLSIERGSVDGRQVLEALALLVAVKLRASDFTTKRLSLQVRGDNVRALVFMIKMRPKTAQLAIIAREMALCLATASFPPCVIHTPAMAHKVADMLSRVAQHAAIGKAAEAHDALSQSERVPVPATDTSFHKTLHNYSNAPQVYERADK